MEVGKFLVAQGVSLTASSWPLSAFWYKYYKHAVEDSVQRKSFSLEMTRRQWTQDVESIGLDQDSYTSDALTLDFNPWMPLSKLLVGSQVSSLQRLISLTILFHSEARSRVEICRMFKEDLDRAASLDGGEEPLLRLIAEIYSWPETIHDPGSAEVRDANFYLVSILTRCVAREVDLHNKWHEVPFCPGPTPLRWVAMRQPHLEPLAFPAGLEKGQAWRNRSLQDWVRALQSAGVDIVEYGEREAASGSWAYDHDDFLGFAYGPNGEDWHLWFREKTDKYAGDFWDMVEHPERSMPGVWVEDYEYWGH